MLWVRGGFPEGFLAPNEYARLIWRQAFIRTLLEQYVTAYGLRIPKDVLYRLFTMLARQQGQLLNASELERSVGVDAKTVMRYVDLMTDLLYIRRLSSWHIDIKKRLVMAPKIYVRDSGIVHALLSIPDRDALLGHPVCGSSWEGFVIENL